MSKVLVAIRTHIWDDDTKNLAFKLYNETTDFDFVVLFDETKQTVNTTPFEKVSHTSDMTSLNLPHWPSDNTLNLHYNGDYALYALRQQKPNYDLYLMLEGDATINIDITSILIRCLHEQIDFIGLIDQINDPANKPFFTNILQWFPNYARAFFPLIIASGKLIDALYYKRLELLKKDNIKDIWPYCEAFVGSFIVNHPEYKYLNLNQIADVSDFTWLNHKHINDSRAYKKGTIVHPITSNNFVMKNLCFNDVWQIFNENSTLFTGVENGNIQEYLPILEREIKRKKDANLLLKFWNFALSKKWIKLPHPINIAFTKPATQSSICSASRFQNTEQDASLLVDGILEYSSRSHTNYEEKPWVMIDLIDQYEIRNIFIYVRPDCHHAFCDYRIDTSTDGQTWITLYKKLDGIVPNSINMEPIIIGINKGNKARFIKIVQETKGWLHLNQIEVYAY